MGLPAPPLRCESCPSLLFLLIDNNYDDIMTVLDQFKQHSTKVRLEGQKADKLRCKFCGDADAGITRITVHFAGIKGKPGAEAKRCQKVSQDVRQAAL